MVFGVLCNADSPNTIISLQSAKNLRRIIIPAIPSKAIQKIIPTERSLKMEIENRLKDVGIELPPAVQPVANYVPAVRSNNLIFLSGHGPFNEDGSLITGKVGADLTVDQGYETARRIAIGLLGSLKAEIGNLDKVTRVGKLLGFVNCLPEFADQPGVINGASDFLVEVFGENGKHARSAVGTNALPFNIAVEIEMIVEVED
jgi:enamine deaminase RidA (YjgF/YER057c/UK114 family)